MASPPRPPRRARPNTDARASRPSLSGEEAPPDLAAVEAAIARLEGRNPELAADVAIAKRESEKRREELRAVVDDAQRRVEASELRKRRLLIAGAAAAVVAIGLGVGLYVSAAARSDAAAALRAATESAAAPLREAGFRDRSFHAETSVAVKSEPGTCYVAIGASTSGPAEVQLERGVERVKGAGSAAWCGCSDAEVQIGVTASGPAGVQILLGPAGSFGGADLLAERIAGIGAVLPETEDRACAAKAVDELVADAPALEKASEDGVAKGLAAAGLEVLGVRPPEEAFVRLTAAADTCFLVRSEVTSDVLTLRLAGGAEPLVAKAGSLAVCQGKPDAASSVWREGRGRLWVFAAPMARIGGSIGLSETLDRVAFGDVPIHHAPELFAAEARAVLLASGASEAHLVEGGATLLGAAEPPYLFAFVAADTSSARAVAGDRGPVACDPPLASEPTSALCLGPAEAFQGVGAKRANRPEWLRVGADPTAYGEVLELLSLARRLSLLGFSPTSVAGVTATPTGADVVGRAGESAVVAVAVTPKAPYLRPLTDGPSWTIDGDPRIVPLAPGARVSLVATPPYGPFEDKGGGIVIFRR